MMESGKISILMGIYNCESTLREAVMSIIDQTYKNWELILCDDGSSDHTLALAKELAASDERIIVIKNDKNMGLNHTLNHCLSFATGEFVARMDGDDVCDPTRFEKQVHFLNSQNEFSIVSSSMYFFDETGVWGRNHKIANPQKEDVVKGSPICHAPVMMRKECYDAVKGYTVDKRMIRVEDVNLWIKLYAAGYKCHNLPEALYGMRNDKNALNRRKFKYRINETYVRLLGCKTLHMGMYYYIVALRPIFKGLVPPGLRMFIRKIQWGAKK